MVTVRGKTNYLFEGDKTGTRLLWVNRVPLLNNFLDVSHRSVADISIVYNFSCYQPSTHSKYLIEKYFSFEDTMKFEVQD